MSEVVTDFVKKYVTEYGILPLGVDHPADRLNDTPSATKAKQGKVSKEAS